MIHTNELMLGNWVEYTTGLHGDKRCIPMYVVGIFSDTVYLNFNGKKAMSGRLTCKTCSASPSRMNC